MVDSRLVECLAVIIEVHFSFKENKCFCCEMVCLLVDFKKDLLEKHRLKRHIWRTDFLPSDSAQAESHPWDFFYFLRFSIMQSDLTTILNLFSHFSCSFVNLI